MTETDQFFSIFQHLNPSFASAWQLLTHHTRRRTSFVVQLWGQESSSTNRIVNSIKHEISRLDKNRVAKRPANDIFIDFDNTLLSTHISSRTYSKCFLATLVQALKDDVHKVTHIKPVQDNHESSSESSATCSEEDIDRNQAIQATQKSDIETDIKTEKHQFTKFIQEPSSRQYVGQIISIFRGLCANNKRIIIVIRRFDLLLKITNRLLYGLLNFLSDSESSIILITTTHMPRVSLEKRICSRYKPFLLPVMPSFENLHSKVLNLVSKSSTSIKNRLLSALEHSLALKLCDTGLAAELISSYLSEIRDNKTSSPGKLFLASPCDQLCNQFDPLLPFHNYVHIPGIYEAFYLYQKKEKITALASVHLVFSWLENVRCHLHETFVIIVAIFISLENNSHSIGEHVIAPKKIQENRSSLFLKDYGWLRSPTNYKSSYFTAEYLIQNIFPLEGGVFNITNHLFENRAHSFSWIFSEASHHAVLKKFDMPGSEGPLISTLLSDKAWIRTIVWLTAESRMLYHVTPSMLALTFPPYHCIYLIQERMKRMSHSIDADEHAFHGHVHKLLQNAKCDAQLEYLSNIFGEVKSEILIVSQQYEEHINHLMRTRNVI